MKIRIFNKYVQEVTNLFGIDNEELFEKSKKRKVVDARHLLYYLCYNRPMRLRYIQDYMEDNGYVVGHSSILHGITQVNKKIEEDKDYKQVIESVS
jgi:chromosomal replication initiation ATPase DnaA